jgi:polygalacturonase
MNRYPRLFLAILSCLPLAACQTTTTTAPVTKASQPGDEIVAALPVIPEARFSLLDFGGVGDGKTFNTDAFKNAIAAIAKAGGGHLIVPAGTYKTLPFTLTSHFDLHLEPGAIIKAPDTFADYGLPDPNQPLPPGAEPAGRRASPARLTAPAVPAVRARRRVSGDSAAAEGSVRSSPAPT